MSSFEELMSFLLRASSINEKGAAFKNDHQNQRITSFVAKLRIMSK